MGILRDMYNGKSGYFGEHSIDTPEYMRCANKLTEIEAEILRKHPDIGELLNELQDVQSKAASIAEYEMFVCGFRTGAQLMLEMIDTSE